MVASKSAPSKPAANKARETPKSRTTAVEIGDRSAIARENLRDLVEQAAAYSGASDDELMSRHIAEQEAILERLKKR